jgi:hypothetical protein
MKNRNNKKQPEQAGIFRFGKESVGFIEKNSEEFKRIPTPQSKSTKSDYRFSIIPPKKRKDSYLRKYDYKNKRPSYGYLVIPDLTGTNPLSEDEEKNSSLRQRRAKARDLDILNIKLNNLNKKLEKDIASMSS